MCGIVTAISTENVVPVLLEGLRKLEYRGYDSAGLAVLHDDSLIRLRSAGRVAELATMANSFAATLRRGGVRWRDTFHPLAALRAAERKG